MTGETLSPMFSDHRKVGVVSRRSGTELVFQAECDREDSPIFTVISAPPGFGRGDELLRQARKREDAGNRIVWLKPKQTGHDALSLLLFLSRELTGPEAGLGEASGRTLFYLRGYVLARLTESDAPITLGIDDSDLLFESDGLDELIDLSIESGGRLEVILAHWIARPSRIARLSIKGRARQIDGWDLSLDRERTNAALGLSSESGLGNEIHKRCWGWPVAIESLQRAASASGVVENVIDTTFGPHSEMALLIESEILPAIPEEIREFLILTSIAETIDLGLARKLATDADVLGYMAFLANFSGLVRIEGTSFQLNPLVRSHLLLLFERLPRSHRVEAWSKLADYYAATNELLLAVRAAFSAEDANKAAAIAEELGIVKSWMQRGFHHMASILHLFSADVIDRYPRLELGRVIDLFSKGRIRLAKALLQDIREKTENFTINPGGKSVEALKLDAMVAELFKELYTDIISPAALESLERECRNERLLSSDVTELYSDWTEAGLFSFKAIAHQQWGAFRKAERVIPLMRMTTLSYKPDGNGFFVRLYDGWTKHATEGPVRGGKAYAEATRFQLEELKQDPTLICLSEIMLAETLYERGRLEEAEAKFSDHITILEKSLAWYDFLAAAYTMSARLGYTKSGMAGALTALDRAEALANERGLPALLRLLPLLRLQFLLGMRELDEARLLISEHGLEDRANMPDIETTLGWRELELLLVGLAEYSLLDRRLPEAGSYIAALQAWSARTERCKTRLIALLLRASLLQRRGERKNAVDVLQTALDEAESVEFIQPFHDMASLINPVLETIASEETVRPGSLIASLISTSDYAPEISGLSQLSPREMEVLQAIAESKSNKGAARALGISDNTIKFHLKRIGVKLNMVGCGRDVLIRSLRRGGQL